MHRYALTGAAKGEGQQRLQRRHRVPHCAGAADAWMPIDSSDPNMGRIGAHGACGEWAIAIIAAPRGCLGVAVWYACMISLLLALYKRVSGANFENKPGTLRSRASSLAALS